MAHYTEDLSRSWLIVPLLFLYLFDLGGVGFLGPDEPRYASVAREMTRSHDFVTPRLNGQPWFEKPPLLYWMTSFGRMLRLPDEWAARLPLALASLGFLVFFFKVLEREFSPRIAIGSTAILATSAGWLAYSFVALPDLPMSAAFGAAALIAMFDTRREQGYLAGALIGLAVLAKGFVPLVLFVPMFLVARRKRLTMIAGGIVVAAPWYIACTVHNGAAFWREFFWKQQVGRFFAESLQHVQPRWYYIPIILAGLFPWTPLAGLLLRKKTYDDARVRFLIAWLVYALLFFSLAKNKLPGYVLPLFPALAIVLAIGVDQAGKAARWWLGASTLMLVALPAIAGVLPDALLVGIRKAPLVLTPALPFVIVAAAVWWLAWREKPNLAILCAAMAVLFGIAYFKGKAFPELDDRVSVRGFWREKHPPAACVESTVRRELVYGLEYYANRPVPVCDAATGPRITIVNERLALE